METHFISSFEKAYGVMQIMQIGSAQLLRSIYTELSYLICFNILCHTISLFFLNGVLKFETLCPILLLCSTRVQGHCGRWVKMGEGRFFSSLGMMGG